ncbi:hypothetical protein DM860_011764 [Cuscuta australis]|uniref:C2H2-type domain-containing protein n=1 Tax=Cuscuta australis TaxID=267555 RepID=A0A328DFG8_9ASTE|nr:hypothetical protein DM860_011764 [Cuscuta australis]
MAEENNQKHELSSCMSSVPMHYCKVCMRGFNCAGALGGHMRSHTLGDHGGDKNFRDDQEYLMVGDTNNDRPLFQGQKHSYFLRANTNRFIINNTRGIRDHDHDEGDKDNKGVGSNGSASMLFPSLSSKYSQSCTSTEEEDLANCLMMLSSPTSFQFVSSASNDNKRNTVETNNDDNNNNIRGSFPCKACNRVFNSHQALGGHRASHKKVKGCYATMLADVGKYSSDELLDSDYTLPSPLPTTTIAPSRKRPRVHECSICHRVFNSGQALGGHKRCHWLAATNASPDATFMQNFQEIEAYHNATSTPFIFKNPFLTAASSELLDLDYSTTNNNNNNKNNSVVMNRTLVREERVAPNLRDLKLDGGSSSSGWLQMGIASAPLV